MPFLKATATSTPRGDAGRFIAAKLSPAVKAAVEVAGKAVLEEAQRMAPVRTGALRDSGELSVTETDKTATAHIAFTADYAAYVEFGTGRRGASSAGAGAGPYDPNWPGMEAQPFMRPALDSTREVVKEIFRSQIAIALKS